MIKWKKPSGLEIETNDEPATVEYCESLGWKRSKGRKPQAEPVEPQAEPVEPSAEELQAEAPRRRPPAG